MIRQLRRDKLMDTAQLRYSDDEAARRNYITKVLDASERHDETHYWISDEAFARLKSDLGPRQPLATHAVSPNTSSRSVGLRGIASAIASVARTSVGIGRATDAQVEARLSACRSCPDCRLDARGEPSTCGELMRTTGRTCGCAVKIKARDIKQDCPQGKWA